MRELIEAMLKATGTVGYPSELVVWRTETASGDVRSGITIRPVRREAPAAPPPAKATKRKGSGDGKNPPRAASQAHR